MGERERETQKGFLSVNAALRGSLVAAAAACLGTNFIRPQGSFFFNYKGDLMAVTTIPHFFRGVGGYIYGNHR